MYGQEEEEEKEEVEEDVYDVSSGHRHALHVSTKRINCGSRLHTRAGTKKGCMDEWWTRDRLMAT